MPVRRLLLAVLLASAVARFAAAHGTPVQLSAPGGRLQADRSYYVSDSAFHSGSFLKGDLPGFEIASPASGIPSGVEVALRPTGKLWYWSPTTRGLADATATLAISNAAGEVRELTGTAAELAPLPIAPYLGESPWHWHVDYFLAPLAAAPGGYAVLLAPEAAGLAAGDPFLLVFGLLGQEFAAADLPEAASDLVAAALGSGPRLPGDANLDGQVDLSDFGILKAHFGQSAADWSAGDFDQSGGVDLSDFGLLKTNFGQNGPLAVPEPATRALLAMGLAGLAGLHVKRRPRRMCASRLSVGPRAWTVGGIGPPAL